ncbi:MAG: hypothetical protein Q7T82_00710 [Armatimonadota bacterium]|nr:hypothetical protein [Armatimonadota bacterium]
MTRVSKLVAVSVVLALALAAPAFAQGQGGQFGQFREQHKFTFQLMQMVRHIGEIDKAPKYALSPGQAQQVLAVLKPLRGKPKLTQDQAKQALKDLKRVFTVVQLNAMARIKPAPRRGGPGFGAGGAGGPGSSGGPGGNMGSRPRTRMDPNAMKNFNPFYRNPKATDEWSARRAQRWDRFFSGLERKSKQAKASRKPGRG